MASRLSSFRGEVDTSQGFKWAVDDMDTFWTWVLSCERFAIQTFTTLVKNCDYFIDIGANRGYYSLVALANSSNVKVDSIEANLQTSKILIKNLDQFKGRNFRVLDFALGSVDGTGTIYRYSNLGSGADTLFPQDQYGATIPKKVSIRKLDLVADHETGARVIMKIDVEGGEIEVLKGGLEFLKNLHPIIIIEVNMEMLKESGGSQKIHEILSNLKYRAYWINEKQEFIEWKENSSPPHKLILGSSYSANYLFIPSAMNLQSLDLIN